MKNLLTLILTFLLFTSNGQDTITNKTTLNLEFGPSTTSLTGNYFLYNKIPTTNFLIGYRVEYNLTKWLSYNIGLLYDRKGQNYKYPLRDDNNNVIVDNGEPIELIEKNQLNYLTLPMTARLKLGNKHKLVHTVGVYGSYLINNNRINKSYEYENVSYDLFDFGLSLGIGGEFKLNNKLNINIELRDNLGLYKISNNDRNNSLSFVTGLGFKF